MDFKYQRELARFVECPPPNAEPCERDAFRFVFEVVDDRSFVPVAKLNPSRQFENEHECCMAHALSMFATQETPPHGTEL